jgi:hypothetical protein
MRHTHARCIARVGGPDALVALVLLAWSRAAGAADSVSTGSDRCEAYPDECRVRTPAPEVAQEVIFVRRAAPSPLRASHGFQAGLRVGVAHPGGLLGGGSVATTPHVSDVAETWVPFGLDAGYRFAPWVYLGGSVLWGGTFGNDSALCAACGFRYDFQALADLRFYAAPNSIASPWISFGAGWEVMHVNFETGGPTATATYQGPVLGNLQIGLDLRGRAVAVGPSFGVGLAEFTVHSLDPSPAGESSSVGAHALHEWFTLGLRASYGP